MYAAADPTRSNLIAGALGDGSRFHETFAYFAHGADGRTAILPEGWERTSDPDAIPPRGASSRRAVAVCPEPHDLVLSYCTACRDRDWVCAEVAARAGLVDVNVLLVRVEALPVDDATRAVVTSMLSTSDGRLSGRPPT